MNKSFHFMFTIFSSLSLLCLCLSLFYRAPSIPIPFAYLYIILKETNGGKVAKSQSLGL